MRCIHLYWQKKKVSVFPPVNMHYNSFWEEWTACLHILTSRMESWFLTGCEASINYSDLVFFNQSTDFFTCGEKPLSTFSCCSYIVSTSFTIQGLILIRPTLTLHEIWRHNVFKTIHIHYKFIKHILWKGRWLQFLFPRTTLILFATI